MTLAGSLPAHLHGRTSFGGPVSGAYVTFAITTQVVAIDGNPEFMFVAPFDMRIMAVSHGAESITGTGATVTVVNDTTTLVAAVATSTPAPAEATLVEAARNVTKGDTIHVNFDNNGGQSSTGVCVLITAYVRAHAYADPASD